MTTEQTPQWKQPKNWRWMQNMTAIDRDTGSRGVVTWVGADTMSVMRPGATRLQTVSIIDAIPDHECPATLGCMLAIARELWGDPTMAIKYAYAPDMAGQWATQIRGAKLSRGRYHTEFDALSAAIDGAP